MPLVGIKKSTQVETYTIKAGQKNFRPIEPQWPIWKPKGFRLKFRVMPGAWASEEEWGGDKDYSDWMKIGGLTSFFSLNDYRSAFVVMNYGKEPETWNVGGYTNFPGKNWKGEIETVTVNSNSWVETFCKFSKSKVEYKTSKPFSSGLAIDTDPFVRKFTLARRVGTYPGGDNNSPGPYGGRAFKDMEIEMEFELLK